MDVPFWEVKEEDTTTRKRVVVLSQSLLVGGGAFLRLLEATVLSLPRRFRCR